MASLPSYVKVLANGYEEQRGKGALVRSSMESGPAKQRRVQSRSIVTRPVTLMIESRENYLAWIEWVKTTLIAGSDWFTWTDPVDGTTKQGRVVNGEYTATPQAGLRLWMISLTLETWE